MSKDDPIWHIGYYIGHAVPEMQEEQALFRFIDEKTVEAQFTNMALPYFWAYGKFRFPVESFRLDNTCGHEDCEICS